MSPGRLLCLLVVGLEGIAACQAAEPIVVSEGQAGAYEVSLAAGDERLYVGWYDTRDGNGEIYLRTFDADGVPGAELRLTETSAESYEVSLAAADDGVLLAWYEKAADGRMDAQLAAWRGGEALVWQRGLRHDERATRNPVIRRQGARAFVAWIATDSDGKAQVLGRWYSLGGQPIGDPVVLGAAGETTWNLNAAVDASGTAWVAWDAVNGNRAEEIFIARLSGDQATLDQVSRDDGHRSKYPDIAIDARRLALTWFDERDGNREVYLVISESRDLSVIETRARRVTQSPGASIGAYLALSAEGVGLVWSDDSRGANDVYFQTFAHDGEPRNETAALTRTPEESLIPAIVPWRAGFAVAWNEVRKSEGGYHAADTRSSILLLTDVGARGSVDPDAAGVER